MAKNKTTQNKKSVTQFLNAVANEKKRKDAIGLLKIIETHTGMKPAMWGPSIVGFGSYHYKYDSGREGDAPLIAFSPRAAALTLYVIDFEGRQKLLDKLGNHTCAKGCIYIKKLEDIDVGILIKLIDGSIKSLKKRYPG